jgi:hypothetical protein
LFNDSQIVPELALQTYQNIKILKNNQLEAQMNAQINKRQNLSRKIVAAWQKKLPPLNISGFFFF